MKARITILLACCLLTCHVRTFAVNVDVEFVDASSASSASGDIYVSRNVDDDDKNEQWDKDQNEGQMLTEQPAEPDDDLKKFKVTTSIEDGTLSISVDSSHTSNVRFWADEHKKKLHDKSWTVTAGKIIEAPPANPNAPPDTPDALSGAPANQEGTEGYFWVEGLVNSASLNDIEIKAEIGGQEDPLKISVIEVDLDVDSKNEHAFDTSGFDTDAVDKIEKSNETTDPGRIVIFSSSANSDGDQVPDFADGFKLKSPSEFASCANLKFVPLRVDLKTPFDPQNAKVSFHYEKMSKPKLDGDDAGLSVSGAGTSENPYVFTVLKGGMRLWNKKATERTSGNTVADDGNFIPVDEEIEWSKIAESSGSRTGWVYVEYVEKETPEYAGKKEIKVTAKQTVGATLEASDTVNVCLLPMEVAPEVLAVNSDFDEGRIDPATGYAIPDCDDMAGVDLKTGAGNTKLELDAERNHLDGIFTQGEDVVDDLHKGWFGVNPNLLEDDFWDGANVTIRKIDKIDDETGYKESGQVRFYAKWSGGYYGISPYDFQTLQPVNLVSAGVNLRPGEGVYGASSTIPNGAEFYMEGVRPGKITLEWRLQKGSIDVKHEQTFKMETRKSPEQWKQDLAYKIRLDTSTDPSGEVDVTVPPSSVPSSQWGMAAGYWVRMERLSECYDYYQENFITDQAYQWCGMARLAGSQVVAGISDAHLGSPGSINTNMNVGIAQRLFIGGFDISDSVGWQFHAYRSSSIQALKWTSENFTDDDLNSLFFAWEIFHEGFVEGDQQALASAAFESTDYEQNVIIVPTWEGIQATWEDPVTNMFSNLAKNIMDPNGATFLDAVPGGRLSNTADRWKWIDDGSKGGIGTPNGIIGAWKAAGTAIQLQLVGKTLREDAERFDMSGHAPAVNDHLNQP